MRGAYGDTLVELGRMTLALCVLEATQLSLLRRKSLATSTERMFNVGIAEANIVSVAAGLVIAGKIAFASTYAAFILEGVLTRSATQSATPTSMSS